MWFEEEEIQNFILELLDPQQTNYFTPPVLYMENNNVTFNFVFTPTEEQRTIPRNQIFIGNDGKLCLAFDRRFGQNETVVHNIFSLTFSQPIEVQSESTNENYQVHVTRNEQNPLVYSYFCRKRETRRKTEKNLVIQFATIQSGRIHVYKECYLRTYSQTNGLHRDQENTIPIPIRNTPFLIRITNIPILEETRPFFNNNNNNNNNNNIIYNINNNNNNGFNNINLNRNANLIFRNSPHDMGLNMIRSINVMNVPFILSSVLIQIGIQQIIAHVCKSCVNMLRFDSLECSINIYHDHSKLKSMQTITFTFYPLTGMENFESNVILENGKKIYIRHLNFSQFFVLYSQPAMVQQITLTVEPSLSFLMPNVINNNNNNNNNNNDNNNNNNNYNNNNNDGNGDQMNDSNYYNNYEPGQGNNNYYHPNNNNREHNNDENFEGAQYYIEDFLRTIINRDEEAVVEVWKEYPKVLNHKHKGYTPLYYAFISKKYNNVKKLLSLGANPYIVQKNGDRVCNYKLFVRFSLEIYVHCFLLENEFSPNNNSDPCDEPTPNMIIKNVLSHLFDSSQSQFKDFFVSLSCEQIFAFYSFFNKFLRLTLNPISFDSFPEILKTKSALSILSKILPDYLENLSIIKKFIKLLQSNQILKYSEKQLTQHIFLSNYIEDFTSPFDISKSVIRVFQIEGKEILTTGKKELFVTLPKHSKVKFLKKKLANSFNIKQRSIVISRQIRNAITYVADYYEVTGEFDFIMNVSSKTALQFKYWRDPCIVYCDLDEKQYTIFDLKIEIINQITRFRSYQPEDLVLKFNDSDQVIDNNKHVSDYLALFKNRDNSSINNIGLYIIQAPKDVLDARDKLMKPFASFKKTDSPDFLLPKTSIDNVYLQFFEIDAASKKNTDLDDEDKALLLQVLEKDFLKKRNESLYNLKNNTTLGGEYDEVRNLIDVCCRSSQKNLPYLTYGYYNISEKEYKEFENIFKKEGGSTRLLLPSFLLTTTNLPDAQVNKNFNVIFKIHLQGGQRNGVVRIETGKQNTYLLSALSCYEIIGIRNEEIELVYLDAVTYHMQKNVSNVSSI